LLFLFSSAGATLITKFQDQYVVGENEEGERVYFYHPLLQCCMMFMGEFLCLPVYITNVILSIISKSSKKDADDQWKYIEEPCTENMSMLSTLTSPSKIQAGKRVIFLISFITMCDMVAFCSFMIALSQCAASVFEMLKGLVVVVTAILSVVFLRRKLHVHHISSILMILSGQFIIGYLGIHGNETTTSSQGVMFLLTAVCFESTVHTIREKLFKVYEIDESKVIGLEGFWGVLIFIFALPMLQQFNTCTWDICKDGYLENPLQAWE